MTRECLRTERVVDIVCSRSDSRQTVQVRGRDAADVVPSEPVHGYQQYLAAARGYPRQKRQEDDRYTRHVYA